MPKSKTFFQQEWLNESLHPSFKPWLEKDPQSNSKFVCRLCFVSKELSNMGIAALNSHAGGKKHKQKIASLSLPSIRTLVNVSPTMTVATVPPTDDSIDHTSANDPLVNDNNTPIVNVPQDQQQTPALRQVRVISKDASKSELIWALKSVDSHRSMNSAANEGTLFKMMFPDSEIAQTFSLGSDKMAYLIHYGLAPYFKDNLEDKLKKCPAFVVAFDEAHNKIAQKGQMDVIIRFIDEENSSVVNRYI
jgi:hypothetical protein